MCAVVEECGDGDFAEAIADFSTAIDLMPFNAVPFNGRGKAALALGRPAGAMRDFSRFGADDEAAFQALARRIARRLTLRRSRRWKAARRGARLDLRRTLRGVLRTGGDPIRLERRQRKRRRTSLVALCDVSGSMELYARVLLQFLHALQNTYARVETFAFATRLCPLPIKNASYPNNQKG